jgi:hypothetical protein
VAANGAAERNVARTSYGVMAMAWSPTGLASNHCVDVDLDQHVGM